MRIRTWTAGCVVVGVAIAAYYGAAPAQAGAHRAAAAVRTAAGVSGWTARGVLESLPLIPLSSPSTPEASGGGWDQVRPRPDLQRGLTPAERHAAVKAMLASAAREQRLDPGLVMAVAWWESGWDMGKVSETGAIGIMQIDPATARELGPRLLGRAVDAHLVADNIELGAAVLKADIKDAGGSVDVGLASYYEGANNVDPADLDADAQAYVAGVKSLQQQFDAGKDPA